MKMGSGELVRAQLTSRTPVSKNPMEGSLCVFFQLGDRFGDAGAAKSGKSPPRNGMADWQIGKEGYGRGFAVAGKQMIFAEDKRRGFLPQQKKKLDSFFFPHFQPHPVFPRGYTPPGGF